MKKTQKHFSHCYGFRNFYGGHCAKYQSENGSTPSSETFKSWIRVESLTHCLFCHPASPVASMASYCGTSYYHCLVIYYQNFCADAARICKEFHCTCTPYICNFMTLLDRKKSVHLEENSTCSQEYPTDSLSPPVSIYVFESSTI